jgi:hypothetical protein
MNKSKRIGTEGENRVLTWLRAIWGPGLSRSETGRPGWDITPTPLPVESKRHGAWRIPEWTRHLTRVHDGKRWALFVQPRDRRRKDAPPDLMIVPADFGVELLAEFYDDWWVPGIGEDE